MQRPHYVAASEQFGQRRPSVLSFLALLLCQDVCFVMIVIGPADHGPFFVIYSAKLLPPHTPFLPPRHSEPDRGVGGTCSACALCVYV